MALEVRWEELSLPGVWAAAATARDRAAAGQLIEVVSQRAVPPVNENMEKLRADFLADSLADLSDELSPPGRNNIGPVEQERRLALLVPTVDLTLPQQEQRPGLDHVLPCWLQRWMLWPVAAMRWEEGQRAAALDAACTDDTVPGCAQRSVERTRGLTPQGATAARQQRNDRRLALQSLPPNRQKSLGAITGAPPSPLLTLAGRYVARTSSRLAAELTTTPPIADPQNCLP